eukprot:scaffold95617_cov63-Phaeocystis_antarctica.AAC.1
MAGRAVARSLLQGVPGRPEPPGAPRGAGAEVGHCQGRAFGLVGPVWPRLTLLPCGQWTAASNHLSPRRRSRTAPARCAPQNTPPRAWRR